MAHENLFGFRKFSKYDDSSNPLTNFLFALKAPVTKSQYPKRLEVFFDFPHLTRSFKNKVLDFLS